MYEVFGELRGYFFFKLVTLPLNGLQLCSQLFKEEMVELVEDPGKKIVLDAEVQQFAYLVRGGDLLSSGSCFPDLLLFAAPGPMTRYPPQIEKHLYHPMAVSP